MLEPEQNDGVPKHSRMLPRRDADLIGGLYQSVWDELQVLGGLIREQRGQAPEDGASRSFVRPKVGANVMNHLVSELDVLPMEPCRIELEGMLLAEIVVSSPEGNQIDERMGYEPLPLGAAIELYVDGPWPEGVVVYLESPHGHRVDADRDISQPEVFCADFSPISPELTYVFNLENSKSG